MAHAGAVLPLTRLAPRRSRRFRLAAFFFAALASRLAAAADSPATEPYVWRNVVVKGGGFVSGLVYHPRERGLLYARTDVGGAYRWDPSTLRWQALNDDLGSDHADWLGVLSLAVDPADANAVFLACGSYTKQWGGKAAVLRSFDRGATWATTPLPFKLGGNEDGRSTGERLQVDPANGQTLLLGTSQDGLWRSEDRGGSWIRLTGYSERGATLVAFGPPASAAAGMIFVGGADVARPALWRSTDAGRSWQPVPGTPAGLVFHHAGFDRAGRLYLAGSNALGPNGITGGAVWKLEPRGDRWSEITPLKPDAAAGDAFGYAGLAVVDGERTTIVVSTLDRWRHRDEMFRSTDGGGSWTPLLKNAGWDDADTAYVKSMKPHWIGAVALNPFDVREAWFVTGYGVWQSTTLDAGDRGDAPRWVFNDAGLEETVIDDLVSPSEGVPLLSAMGDLGGFRHADLQRSPADGMFRPLFGSNQAIAVAAQRPSFVVRTMHGGKFGAISLDGGATWREFATAPATATPPGAGGIAVSVDGRHLVWLPKGSAPYYSDDQGASWTASGTTFTSTRDFFFDRPLADGADPAVFYIYDHAAGCVHVSRDGGRTFVAAASVPARAGNLQAEPGAAGQLWLPSAKGVAVSSDFGRTFSFLRGVDAGYQVGFGPAVASQPRPAVYLAGKVNGVSGVHRSDDGGRSWISITDAAHQFGWLRVLTGDPRVPGRVYLGTSGRGIVYGEPRRR